MTALIKQVMKPRSYRLENLAILAALVAFAMWLGACGVDAPYVGTLYQCKGHLVCDGQPFGITGKTCSDSDNVEEDYVQFSEAWAEHQGVKCQTLTVEDVECTDTAEVCSY